MYCYAFCIQNAVENMALLWYNVDYVNRGKKWKDQRQYPLQTRA